MVRYERKQNIKKQLKQRDLLSTRSRDLRTRSQTILKTDMIHTSETTKTKTETKLRLKRKLMVYKKNGRFYIDNSAAYALKLTNVRAIMTENPHLIEIDLETLYRFQSNEGIEIEYQELDKEKESKIKKSDLAESLDELEQGEYGIGIHGIDKGSREEKQAVADSISNEGVNINNNSKTILSTAISLGTNDDMQRIRQEIIGYKFGNGTKTNAVIAVPLYIENESGEKIFLGFPDQNKRTAGQQYEEHCILDRICSKLQKIPPQFVLGYYCENPDGSESFIKNEQHYSNLDSKEREVFFTEVSSNMDDVSKNYNDLIASGNVEQLSQIKGRMQQLGWKAYIVDNAITLVQKYKEQTKFQNTSKRKIRQVILDTSEQNDKLLSQQRKNVRSIILDNRSQAESLSDSTKSRRIRRILLDACTETKLSDITTAKATLREGLEEQEKGCDRKEI